MFFPSKLEPQHFKQTLTFQIFGCEESKAGYALADQALLDRFWTIPWNSWIGRRPSTHFLCVWEELQPPGLKCISWLYKTFINDQECISGYARSSVFIHRLIDGGREGGRAEERLMEMKMSSKETRWDPSLWGGEGACTPDSAGETKWHWWMNQEMRRYN